MKKFFVAMLTICMILAVSLPAYAAQNIVSMSVETAATSEEDGPSVRGPYKGMVLYNGVNIRSGPGTQYPSYGHMNKGDIVWIYNYNHQPWAYVLCDSPHKGQFAYIHMQYIQEIAD